jgi:hypothetical protein
MTNKQTFSLMSGIILLITFLLAITHPLNWLRFVDSWFIVSGLLTTILLFKHILDRGGFDPFRYSWHKTKRHLFFFLPRNWQKKSNELILTNYEGEEEVIDDFEDFIAFRKANAWKNMPILFATVLTHLTISVILSLLIYFK